MEASLKISGHYIEVVTIWGGFTVITPNKRYCGTQATTKTKPNYVNYNNSKHQMIFCLNNNVLSKMRSNTIVAECFVPTIFLNKTLSPAREIHYSKITKCRKFNTCIYIWMFVDNSWMSCNQRKDVNKVKIDADVKLSQANLKQFWYKYHTEHK